MADEPQLTPAERQELLHAHRHAGELSREIGHVVRRGLVAAGLACWSDRGRYGYVLTTAGRALARRLFAAQDAAWDPPAEPAVGQVWRNKGRESRGDLHDLRVEAVDQRYVHGRGTRSRRRSRVLRGTGRRTGPMGYRLLEDIPRG
jgi:hypothetical protein